MPDNHLCNKNDLCGIPFVHFTGILKEHGINIQSGDSDYSICFDKTFEEEIEMVVSESRETLTTSCRKGGHYSISGLFRQIYRAVRRTKASRIMYKLQEISDADMRETIDAVARELSIGYEYQIAMVTDQDDIYKMADYAVLCVMCYLKSTESTFETSSILQAVLECTPKHVSVGDAIVKTRIIKTDTVRRKHSQKWKIKEVFKEPGLRVQDAGGYKFYGCFTPFGCQCRPKKYGYRAPLHVWAEDIRAYRMLNNDRISCHSSHDGEIAESANDIHQQYKPETCCCHVTQITCSFDSKVTENCNGEPDACAIIAADVCVDS